MIDKIQKLLHGRKPKKPIVWGGIGLVVLIVLAFAFGGSSNDGKNSDADLAVVRRGELMISVTESGTIRPRDQVVLKNKLSDPATILFIVDEGSIVKKGELLVELDVTRVEDALLERRIRLQNAEAALIHAQENMKVVENQAAADADQAALNHRFAVQDLQKYKDGEYPKLLKEAEAKITLAEEELGQAEEKLKWAEILYKEKYLSQSELNGDELAAKKTKLNLELAKSASDLLKQYTYQRQIDQLESDVKQSVMALERVKRMGMANTAQAEAKLAASEAEVREDSARVERYEQEVANAKMHAPIDGMVIYATSVRQRWRRNDEPIRTGSMVDERDEIIYLPTASEFTAAIKVPEVALNKIAPGMLVKLTVDALPEADIRGIVKSIAQMPDADSRYLNPNLKLYETLIEVNDTTAALRNGMSCRAEVIVNQFEDTLYIPLQSVVRLGRKTVVYKPKGSSESEPQEVEIGMDNARFVQVISGLSEGDKILIAPPFTPAGDSMQPAEAEEDSAQVAQLDIP